MLESIQEGTSSFGMSDYFSLKRSAPVVPDNGGYDYRQGELNPEILKMFAREMDVRVNPDECYSENPRYYEPVVWEPFAGTNVAKSRSIAEKSGLELIANDIQERDGVIVADAKNGPSQTIGGMIFHPTYYGSSFSENGDIGSLPKDQYIEELGRVVDAALDEASSGFLACIVARHYMFKGERIDLDKWMIEVFSSRGFDLLRVWSSPPDVALLMKFEDLP